VEDPNEVDESKHIYLKDKVLLKKFGEKICKLHGFKYWQTMQRNG
jgi:hypothetical protein